MPESLLGMIRLNFFYPFGYIVSTYSEKPKMGVRKNILEILNQKQLSRNKNATNHIVKYLCLRYNDFDLKT